MFAVAALLIRRSDSDIQKPQWRRVLLFSHAPGKSIFADDVMNETCHDARDEGWKILTHSTRFNSEINWSDAFLHLWPKQTLPHIQTQNHQIQMLYFLFCFCILGTFSKIRSLSNWQLTAAVVYIKWVLIDSVVLPGYSNNQSGYGRQVLLFRRAAD